MTYFVISQPDKDALYALRLGADLTDEESSLIEPCLPLNEKGTVSHDRPSGEVFNCTHRGAGLFALKLPRANFAAGRRNVRRQIRIQQIAKQEAGGTQGRIKFAMDRRRIRRRGGDAFSAVI